MTNLMDTSETALANKNHVGQPFFKVSKLPLSQQDPNSQEPAHAISKPIPVKKKVSFLFLCIYMNLLLEFKSLYDACCQLRFKFNTRIKYQR